MTALAAALLLAFTGCTLSADAQTGERVMRSFDLRGFSAVEVSGDFIVEVAQGPYSVSLDVPEAMEPYLKVGVKNGELEIGYKNMPVKVSRLFRRSDYRSVAKVSLPDPEEIDLSGACTLTAQDLDCKNLSVDLSGAGRMEISGRFGQLTLDCSGASECTLSGSAKLFSLDCSGASKIFAEELECRKAGIELSGASSTTVCAKEELDIECTGASKVAYKVEDDTIVRIESSGASKITRIK